MFFEKTAKSHKQDFATSYLQQGCLVPGLVHQKKLLRKNLFHSIEGMMFYYDSFEFY